MFNSFYDKFVFTNGLKYKHNNLFLLNLPFVILPTDALVSIAKQGNADTNREIYYAVKSSIKGALKKEFQIDFGVQGERGLEFMEAYFTASGWGKLSRTDLDFEKKHALVSVMNSAVANNSGKSKLPVDTFLRGFLAGIFTIYFKQDVDCVETHCEAVSGNRCNFVIKPLSEFNFENKLTRGQLNVE